MRRARLQCGRAQGGGRAVSIPGQRSRMEAGGGQRGMRDAGNDGSFPSQSDHLCRRISVSLHPRLMVPWPPKAVDAARVRAGDPYNDRRKGGVRRHTYLSPVFSSDIIEGVHLPSAFASSVPSGARSP